MRTLLFVLMVGFVAGAAVAQEPGKTGKPEEKQLIEMARPGPGPEIAKLDYFVGTWMGEETLSFPGMPRPMKSKSKYVAQWRIGGKFLVADYSTTMSDGKTEQKLEAHALWTYDPKKGNYRLWGFDSWGNAGELLGNWTDDKTFVTETSTEMGGQPMKLRDTYTIVSPTKCILKGEMDIGQGWQTIMAATYTKQGDTPNNR